MRYFVPTVGVFDELTALTDRTKIAFHTPSNAYELILMMHESPHGVFAVGDDLLMVVARHPKHFFPEELPTVISNVPGLVYQPGWASVATAFPNVHFRQFSENFKRSGVVSTTPDEMAARQVGAFVSTERSSMSEQSPAGDADSEDHTDVDY